MNDNVKPLPIGVTGTSIKTPRRSVLTRAETTISTLIPNRLSPSATINAAEKLGKNQNSYHRHSKEKLGGKIPRRSLESILTVNSTNQMSSLKYSSSNMIYEKRGAEAIVKDLLTDTVSLKTKID